MASNQIEVSDGSAPSSVALQVLFLREKEYFIAYAPALDLSAYGESMEEAMKAFEDVLSIFLEDVTSKGTLDELLQNLGWDRADEDSRWVPPYIVSQQSKEISLENFSSRRKAGDSCPA